LDPSGAAERKRRGAARQPWGRGGSGKPSGQAPNGPAAAQIGLFLSIDAQIRAVNEARSGALFPRPSPLAPPALHAKGPFAAKAVNPNIPAFDRKPLTQYD